MESFVHDYITSTYYDDETTTEDLLERRLSPYATLRPGDLTALLRFQVSLLPLVNNNRFLVCCNKDEDGHNNVAEKSHEFIDSISEECESVVSGTECDNQESEERKAADVVCRGSDTNDSPAEYTVKGLHHHEMPVIGVCVDNRICPGFRYRVRRAGSNRHFYDNVPKTLLSIGMGYGKRITFSGDSLNNNECFFWSDSDPCGYAFSIHAADRGQKFTILDVDRVIVGEAVLDRLDEPQEELSSSAFARTVVKRVRVVATYNVHYYQRPHHGLVEMVTPDNTEQLVGEAVLTKTAASKSAVLTAIENVFLPRLGICTLEPDA